MKEYTFKISLNEGKYIGTYSVKAENEDIAMEKAIDYFCTKLAEALPEYDIEVSADPI